MSNDVLFNAKAIDLTGRLVGFLLYPGWQRPLTIPGNPNPFGFQAVGGGRHFKINTTLLDEIVFQVMYRLGRSNLTSGINFSQTSACPSRLFNEAG